MDFPYSQLENHTIYTTLHCENNAGLMSTKSSNGVKISNKPPSTDYAEFGFVQLSQTEYPAREMFQGVNDNLRLKWSGFTDTIGIERFEVGMTVFSYL